MLAVRFWSAARALVGITKTFLSGFWLGNPGGPKGEPTETGKLREF